MLSVAQRTRFALGKASVTPQNYFSNSFKAFKIIHNSTCHSLPLQNSLRAQKRSLPGSDAFLSKKQ